jgi:hypothetical protein
MHRTWIALPLILVLLIACSLLYTYAALSIASRQGVYATPQEGVAARAKQYLPDYPDLQINSARPNAHDGSSPHIWYVIWRVCRETSTKDPDCTGGGNFYLHTRTGWVYMSEGYFPEFVGFWMKPLGLAAP